MCANHSLISYFILFHFPVTLFSAFIAYWLPLIKLILHPINSLQPIIWKSWIWTFLSALIHSYTSSLLVYSLKCSHNLYYSNETACTRAYQFKQYFSYLASVNILAHLVSIFLSFSYVISLKQLRWPVVLSSCKVCPSKATISYSYFVSLSGFP
jgi:hypothetical protein